MTCGQPCVFNQYGLITLGCSCIGATMMGEVTWNTGLNAQMQSMNVVGYGPPPTERVIDYDEAAQLERWFNR